MVVVVVAAAAAIVYVLFYALKNILRRIFIFLFLKVIFSCFTYFIMNHRDSFNHSFNQSHRLFCYSWWCR